MKIVIDEICDDGLKEYLLSQDGIVSINITRKDFLSNINIDLKDNVSPLIAFTYINLYLDNKFPIMISFNKNTNKHLKKLKCIVGDMCCEYCYKNLVEELFNNQFVKSVTSNFKYDEPAFNIEFDIEYDDNLNEEDLIKFINKSE